VGLLASAIYNTGPCPPETPYLPEDLQPRLQAGDQRRPERQSHDDQALAIRMLAAGFGAR